MDMTNQPSQQPNPNALAIVPAKRKRGRPRKHPSVDDPNFQRGGSEFRAPPGFRRGSNGNQVGKDSMAVAGQLVSGVIESEFDGGYLLTVKVHNSDITLRGVVFKPGHCDPVTAENDVAPNIQMVHRNEVHSYGRVPKYRSRGRNRVVNPSPLSTSLVAFQGKLASMPPPNVNSQAIVPFRGNVVPVVLQPVVASSNGPTDEMQRQVSRNGSAPLVQDKASSPEVDVKPPPGMPFGKEAATKSGITMEAADGASNLDHLHRQQHLFMEPSRALQHYTRNHSTAVSIPMDGESGKMTKLLQAVQENAMKNQML